MFSRMGADGYHDPQVPATPRKSPGLAQLDGPSQTARLRRPVIRRCLLPRALLACLAVLGCASDESVVCDRLAECDLLDGLSKAECEEQAQGQVPEDRLSKCAECVEDKDCDDIKDDCRSLCEPGD